MKKLIGILLLLGCCFTTQAQCGSWEVSRSEICCNGNIFQTVIRQCGVDAQGDPNYELAFIGSPCVGCNQIPQSEGSLIIYDGALIELSETETSAWFAPTIETTELLNSCTSCAVQSASTCCVYYGSGMLFCFAKDPGTEYCCEEPGD